MSDVEACCALLFCCCVCADEVNDYETKEKLKREQKRQALELERQKLQIEQQKLEQNRQNARFDEAVQIAVVKSLAEQKIAPSAPTQSVAVEGRKEGEKEE
eukprot:509830_1